MSAQQAIVQRSTRPTSTGGEFEDDDDFPLPRTFSDPSGQDVSKVRDRAQSDSDSIQLWNPSEARLRTASESVVKRDKKGKISKK